MSIAGFDISAPVVLLGAITGMTYGVLAVGLVLVFRANRVVNFAHGETGAFAGALLLLATSRWHIPYWIAFVLALVVAAAIGGLSEAVVIKRLRNAPPLMSIVATLGLAQFLVVFALVVNANASAGILYPHPPGLPEFDVGALHVSGAQSGMLFATPVLVLGLFLFLRLSRHGVAITASADNPEAARMAGIPAGRMSALAWMIAGALSAFTAMLVLPTRGFIAGALVGPGLLLRALTAAVLARMTSLPIALGAGVFVGVAEALLFANDPRGGTVEALMFCGILVTLLAQRRRGTRDDGGPSWAAVQPWRPLPVAAQRLWAVRNAAWITVAIGAVAGIAVGALATKVSLATMTTIVAFSIIGLSIGVTTGLGGQLSLGQFALGGVGATASFVILRETGNSVLALVAAGLAAAAASLVIGLPALRLRGPMLVVTTLGFAVAASAWLLQQSWMLGGGVDPGRLEIAGFRLDSAQKYYFFSLAIFGVMLLLTRNVWRGGLGRSLRAARDNENAARAFTLSVTKVKLQAFVLGGFLAGVGGAVYAHSLSRIGAGAFPIDANYDVAALAVLGGLGILIGPVLGAIYIIGVPRFLPLDNAGLAATELGWLVLILYFPGGLAQLLRSPRDRIVASLGRRAGVDLASDVPPGGAVGPVVATGWQRTLPAPEPGTGAALEVVDLSKRFGGATAVEGVSFAVTGGETLGLIGPNGAGKTTLFELIGGFTAADAGTVVVAGRDVSRLTPDARARLGLIRSFQDGALFPTLTVRECVQVALERAHPTRALAEIAGFSSSERHKHALASEVVAMMGLAAYVDKRVSELSTGTRRIVELACLLVLEPSVLLLDEPSSGIAQRETEALGELLQQVKALLPGLTLVVIEHDMPLIMSLADRIIAMESGRVIADGTPAAVQRDPRVLESYLGTDATVLARSEPGLSATEDGRCQGVTRAGARCARPAGADGLCGQHRQLVGSSGRSTA